jgi:hypothetical protein
MMLDFAAVRLNPDRAKDKHLALNIVLSDTKETHLVTIENGVLIHEAGVRGDKADATVTMKQSDLLETLPAWHQGWVPSPTTGAGGVASAIAKKGRNGAGGGMTFPATNSLRILIFADTTPFPARSRGAFFRSAAASERIFRIFFRRSSVLKFTTSVR